MAHLSDPHPPQHVNVHVTEKHKHKKHKKPKVKLHKDKVRAVGSQPNYSDDFLSLNLSLMYMILHVADIL